MRKKTVFWALLTPIFITFLCASLFLVYIFTGINAKLYEDKLIKTGLSVQFFDSENNEINAKLSAKERVDAHSLPPYVTQAFIAVEDKRFYSHNGIDFLGMARALKNNILSKSFKEGGSTITQQLIKNTHLTSEKTFSRKIKEMQLALKLERKYTKEQILDFYLNGVYFGEGVYGIVGACKNYFNKKAQDISLVEACALASTVKAPSVYNPRNAKCEERKNLVLKLMKEQGYISESEFESAKKEKIKTVEKENSDYVSVCEKELFEKLNLSPYTNAQVKVYTYMQKDKQQVLNCTLDQMNQGAIIMSNNGKIEGYKIPQGDFERSPGSTIKPILIYAPAIEEGIVHLHTKVLDEKTSFNGYTPSNYNDKYYGWVSVKDSICKSLNVPAIKVLNALGTEKARLYVDKLNIHIKENGLSIALGSYNGGATLTNLCASYTPFSNSGEYYLPTSIKSIYLNGKQVYEDKIQANKVFNHGTVEIINDALAECAISGTAKAIGKKNYQVCAKTGTVGTEKCNTDAYSICYTSENVIAVRFCNADNSLMPNTITGGEVSKYANEILNGIYVNRQPADFKQSNEVSYVDMCKFSYNNGELALAESSLPKRYTFTAPVLTKYLKNLPISSLSNISFGCQVEVHGDKVNFYTQKDSDVYYKIEVKKGNEFIEIATDKEENFYLQGLVDGEYIFKITPYRKLDSSFVVFGDSVILPQLKITREDDFINSKWWEE